MTLRKLAAEGLGTALLVATVVGSGIMGERLSGGNEAVALLGNTLATGAILVVLITIFAPISGAHFNPAVTLVFALRGDIGAGTGAAYAIVQTTGAIAGTVLAHAMFALPLFSAGQTAREGFGVGLGEVVATFALICTIIGTLAARPAAVAQAVALVISAGYWFTSSTSFANPSVTLARSMTATFSGIRPEDVLLFLGAQLVGLLLAFALTTWLWPRRLP